MKTYEVAYRMSHNDGPFMSISKITVKANNSTEAEYKAIEKIEQVEGSKPYRVWADSYTSKNGNKHQFYYDATI